MKKSVILLCLMLLSVTLYTQAPAHQPLAPTAPGPIKTLPPWAYILGVGGMNTGLLALKTYGPKVPAWAVPLVNVGLTLGGFYLGQGDLASAVFNTGLVSGGSTVVHNLVKNAVRGDTLQQPSVVIRD